MQAEKERIIALLMLRTTVQKKKKRKGWTFGCGGLS